MKMTRHSANNIRNGVTHAWARARRLNELAQVNLNLSAARSFLRRNKATAHLLDEDRSPQDAAELVADFRRSLNLPTETLVDAATKPRRHFVFPIQQAGTAITRDTETRDPETGELVAQGNCCSPAIDLTLVTILADIARQHGGVQMVQAGLDQLSELQVQ